MPALMALLPVIVGAAEIEVGPTPTPEQTADEPSAVVADQDAAADELAVVPNPAYSPIFGATLTLMGLYSYRPVGTSGRPWMAGAAVFAAQNGSWGVGGFNEARIDDETWIIQAGGGYVDLRYDYYGSGPDSPLLDHPVEIRQRALFLGGAVLRQVGTATYVGPLALWRDIRTSPDQPGLEGAELEQGILGLGVKGHYDTRDGRFAPREGIYASTKLVEQFANPTAIGPVEFDGRRYAKADLDGNLYHALGPTTVLAGRLATQWAADGAPFYDLPFLGRGADLRGYSGEYRDQVLVAAQAELRQGLPYRFGINGFAGVGAVAPTYAEVGDGDLHPSLGGSLTWIVAPVNRINMRFDAAWGDEGWTWYLSIGDAF